MLINRKLLVIFYFLSQLTQINTNIEGKLIKYDNN